ncbi:hypothetical protein C8Q74DRAFT_1227518 [Fomes fomentarius]|nr:hypothetical protein C8Q74DRAFT_1227518 [Fomes fomentarius]
MCVRVCVLSVCGSGCLETATALNAADGVTTTRNLRPRRGRSEKEEEASAVNRKGVCELTKGLAGPAGSLRGR